MMKTELLQIRVSSEEKEKIEILAARSSAKNVSEYVRLKALNKKLSSKVDATIAFELIKLNSDLSRLGNLFRLSMKDNNKYTKEQLLFIESQLSETIRVLKNKISSL
ncbi:hypothetical protein FZF11_20405 [Vibrio parahaemolyticus]|uniref:plasmid mobilization protein n=2 Tax=Vibrio parahaemolyticus TaxID=670 RepID=UPI000472769E|nr:hypothetical protein [Vibrio parahaemolyticus]EHC7291019.1 hypothetical protein [Vibrio parahaemolyticus]EJE4149848.1 hypothetical protein [Vibrio parahaemolyticus]MQP57827.1 hypothetical protein [Vibrio parahaemolyticus]MQZ03417.1 hypothetical protein [Vibrio parahaemolyticus]MQZ13176.1 hypothetical protein [Vibrio parahaemolyticus]